MSNVNDRRSHEICWSLFMHVRAHAHAWHGCFQSVHVNSHLVNCVSHAHTHAVPGRPGRGIPGRWQLFGRPCCSAGGPPRLQASGDRWRPLWNTPPLTDGPHRPAGWRWPPGWRKKQTNKQMWTQCTLTVLLVCQGANSCAVWVLTAIKGMFEVHLSEKKLKQS